MLLTTSDFNIDTHVALQYLSVVLKINIDILSIEINVAVRRHFSFNGEDIEKPYNTVHLVHCSTEIYSNFV